MTDARGGNGIGHQVIKFNPNGDVLMRLGKAGVSGSGPELFDQPTVQLMAGDFESVLRTFTADPHTRLLGLQLASAQRQDGAGPGMSGPASAGAAIRRFRQARSSGRSRS